jgi:hypothetical protein
MCLSLRPKDIQNPYIYWLINATNVELFFSF